MISRRLRRVAAGAMLLGMSGCTAAQLLNSTVPRDGTTELHDIAYAPGPNHTLDVYEPVKPGGPLIVFLYGGTWQTGDKAMYAFVGRPLASKGAVVVIPNYRKYPQVEFPGFVEDNAQAVAWAVSHAASLGADPRSVFIMGHSSGAYDAAMLALDPRYLSDAGVQRARLSGMIGLAGPYDFLPITQTDVIPVFASVHDGPASQPISYVDGRNPPMLLLAGKDDTTVNPDNTVHLAAKIREFRGPVEDRLYPGLGHVGLITAFAPLFSERGPVLDDVWAWIQAHLHGG